MSLILNKKNEYCEAILWHIWTLKLLLVVDASSDLKLIIILIIVCINCTVTVYYYNRIILQIITLRIKQS